MLPRALASAAVLVLLLSTPALAVPERVVVVTPYPQTFRAALATFEQTFGAGLIDLRASTTLRCSDLADAAVLYMHGAFWSRDLDACAADVQRQQRRGMLVGGTIPAVFQAAWRVSSNAELNPATPYLRFGGADNVVGFLGAIYNATAATAPLKVADPAPQADAGIYHPRAPGPFFSLDEYLSWYREAGLVPVAAPRVGLTFFQTNLFFGDLAHIDALIAALEARGIAVIPAYGWPLKASQPFLFEGDRPAVELLFCLNLLMPSPENANFLADYGIHAINLTTTTESFEEWSSSRQGLPPGRVSLQLGTAERTGATEPILVATTRKLPDGTSELVPVPERIESAAARAERWLALAHKANGDKRVALVYFNNPPGKALLGASYLDLFPSLTNILGALGREGYFVGDGVPTRDELTRLLLLSGRNVGDYAPGELDAMVRTGHVALLPLEQYEAWYRTLPVAFRRATERVWGAPAQSTLMTIRRDGRVFFVIPGVQIGNLFLGPQPLRDTLEASPEAAHSADRPAPHSYVAYYLWLRNRFKADAMVHVGRHGTLEWLPGKDVAQAESDPGEVLVGALPHLYYYIVDGGGEFLQAKRRSQAIVISHLTPLLAAAGLGPDYVTIKTAIANRAALEEGAKALRLQYEREIVGEAQRLHLFETLGLKSDAASMPAAIERIVAFVEETEEEAVPLGLHTIGSPPNDDVVRDAVRQFLLSSLQEGELSAARPHVEAWADAVFAGRPGNQPSTVLDRIRPEAERWLNDIRVSSRRELESLVRLLSGRSIATGVSGDPLRAPDAVPTGRNLHDQDPRTFPTKSAWELGQRMARSLVDEQRDKNGRYPDTVSFVLWYGESNRTQGLAEAQALSLLGVEPVWNGRGQVDGVRLIPRDRLSRPRVDIVLTMSGLYRDGLPEKLDLLDRAVKLVAEAPDDNVVKRNAIRVESELRRGGASSDEAKRASLVRLFGPAPQAFGTGLDAMMESSQDDNDQRKVAGRYLENMNYAYGGGLDGVRIRGNLAAQLASVSVVVHSRSTNLYGVLDNDETYQFAGGLNAATTVAAGRAPDFLVSNVRRAGQERFETMRTFLARELDSRSLNPKWIAAMQATGYAGAREFAVELEHLYGLRATSPTQVDGSAWQRIADVYVNDRFKLGLPAFFERENPWAQQMLTARLLEVDRQGVYRFSDADRATLLRTYATSIARAGVSCYVNACANLRLQAFMLSEAGRLVALSGGERAALQAAMTGAQRAGDSMLPAPLMATAMSTTFLDIQDRAPTAGLLSSISRALLPGRGLDASWLLVLLPALLSPVYAFRRLRASTAPASHAPVHRVVD